MAIVRDKRLYLSSVLPVCLLFMSLALLSVPQPVHSELAIGNLALGKESYMVRLKDTLPPASNGNDGDLSTVVESSRKTADAYWEVDLEKEYAIHSVDVYAAAGFEGRITHTTLHLFDTAHKSVYSQELDHIPPPVFHVDCGGPRLARYVRVGFEHKERSSANGGVEWYLGFSEVMVWGREVNEIGLLSLEASSTAIEAGQSITLSWSVDSVSNFRLYPGGQDILTRTDANGVGALEVTPTETVEYLLVAKGTFGRHVRAVTVTVDEQPLFVRINEIVAKNRMSLEDGFGRTPDWIELYNPTQEAVDLTGYGLSDDPGNPMRWIFPEILIAPHGTLIVYASKRDESPDPKGGLHTNWALCAQGESVVLTAPDGFTTIDHILAYPPQTEDLAYGWNRQGELGYLDPTPETVNLAMSYEGWLVPPLVSAQRGFYYEPFDLQITHDDPEALVQVSLDQAEPVTVTETDLIRINTTHTVQVSVSRSGYKIPQAQTHTYLFVDHVPTSPVMKQAISLDPRYAERLRKGLMDLPTFSVVMPRLPDDYREKKASVEILWPDGLPSVQADCGMVRFGGAWSKFKKKNYRLKFRKKYGIPKLKAPLFNGFDHGIPVVDSFDELELHGGGHDMKGRGFYMSARFVEDSMLDMGALNPHGRFVHLYINGTYWGQFHLRERLVEHFLADYLGGEPDDYFNIRGNNNAGNNFVPGTPDPVHRSSWQRVRESMHSYQDVKAYVDVPGLIDFTLLWYYGNCESEFRASGPVAQGSGIKFWMADADGFLRTNALGRNPTANTGPSGLFGALVSEGDSAFITLLENRIQTHFTGQGALTPERTTARLLERMTEIEDSLIAECARWGYRKPDNWISSANTIVNSLFPVRTDQLLGYLRDRGLYAIDMPTFTQDGGAVDAGFKLSLASAAPGDVIYYTIDGSDPKLTDGTVSPTAILFRPSETTQPLVPAHTQWAYWDRGSYPGDTWKTPGLDDTSWSSGAAPLGYGDGDERTVISYGPNSSNKYITNYFRHSFDLADPETIDQIQIRLVRDDGAIVYLNGTELVRSNMPEGAVAFDTQASSGVVGSEESQWYVFDLSSESIQTGTNTIAVEIHQRTAGSSDISFDLSLEAHRTEIQPDFIEIVSDTVVKARILSGTRWSPLNEAHFTVNPYRPA